MTIRKLRLGISGLGRAFMLMLPAFKASSAIQLVAAVDPRPEARSRFTAEFGGASYADVEQLVRDPNVDAVYIASPHQFHAIQAIAAAEAGKHILVEKPMTLQLEEAEAMIDSAAKAGVVLLVGHSHSFDAPIATTRKIIASGEFGPLKMISTLNFTDFLYRPRRPEELDTAQGGGVVFNQAAHQVDIARFLAGGHTESVVANTSIWDESRPTEGAYNAVLRFAGDTSATLVYSGYAHLDSDELLDWISETGVSKHPDAFLGTRRALRAGLSRNDERELRRQRGYGVERSAATAVAAEPSVRWNEHFGFWIASCAHADLRPTPTGVRIYADSGPSFRSVAPPLVPRLEVIDELCAAIFDNTAPIHSGRWGMATLEVCLAMLDSSRERREVQLTKQISLPTGH
ncbi:MAG: Gfo/Idh/MocA family protein [Stellaceae bacterium]